MAEREGFEPSWGSRPHPISSRRRYDRFGTSPDDITHNKLITPHPTLRVGLSPVGEAIRMINSLEIFYTVSFSNVMPNRFATSSYDSIKCPKSLRKRSLSKISRVFASQIRQPSGLNSSPNTISP